MTATKDAIRERLDQVVEKLVALDADVEAYDQGPKTSKRRREIDRKVADTRADVERLQAVAAAAGFGTDAS
jgi:hypothetical protein